MREGWKRHKHSFLSGRRYPRCPIQGRQGDSIYFHDIFLNKLSVKMCQTFLLDFLFYYHYTCDPTRAAKL